MAAVGLLVAGVVAPVESLPGPFEGLAPAPPAEAADGTVVAGTPEVCSAVDPDPDDSTTTWTVVSASSDRDCVFTSPAVCPDGHVKPASGGPPGYLCYPQSCSGTSFNVEQLGNYWIGDNPPSTTSECNRYRLTECRTGIGPTHAGLCRYVQRRSWTCADGYVQHNRFNTCYQAHMGSAGTPPPCDTSTGAPNLPLLDCDDYAGDDYDDDADCNTEISSHLTDRSGGDAAAYWCEFDASELSVDCHRNLAPSDADCTPSDGVCLKRASTTRGQQIRALGGCRAVARNIECAILQADYADKVGTGTNLATLADTIRAAGCEPCRVMPFQPLNTSECPDTALTGEPGTIDLDNTQAFPVYNLNKPQIKAFQLKTDTDWGGIPKVSGCQDLPPGRLTWTTPSFTGLAMVNTRVRLNVEWDAANLARVPASGVTAGLGECFPLTSFYFSVEVEPLWPAGDPDDTTDTGDRDQIETLFGAGALGWWDNLDAAEQTDRTAGFYSTTDTDTLVVPCSLQAPVWCIWTPQSAGYYSLTATGALGLIRFINIRRSHSYTGAIPADWHANLTRENLQSLGRHCRATPTPDDCVMTGGSSNVGVYIENEPIGIQVHEVRVVSRTPSP